MVNNKIYVGQHKTSEDVIDQSYYGSGVHLLNAINYYGIDNFTCEILCWCADKETLDQKEIECIQALNATDPQIGYNIQSGGNGGFSHIDISGENNPMYGVHRYGSDNPNYGNKWSEESRQMMSNTIKNNGGHHGEKNPMYGRTHSDKAKEKMKKAKLNEFGEYKYKGERASLYGKHETHPCYGMHWWCDGINPPIKARDCPGEQYHRGRK